MIRKLPSDALLGDSLFAEGIESVSLNPDTAIDTWLDLAQQAGGD